uniref:ER lumen protein-retaining receptor n=1 Tax=Astyanax mexicanus TaxID=7994 RepID=A0A3B1JPQ9_ASTMX
MNVFRLCGDVSAFSCLCVCLCVCAGISGKSQVAVCLWCSPHGILTCSTGFISIYNTVMKVGCLPGVGIPLQFIYSTCAFRNSYDSGMHFISGGSCCSVAGLSFLEKLTPSTPTGGNTPILWTFSIYLESVTGEAESYHQRHYLFFLGLYRALYLANWVWRYHTESFFDQIAVVSGVVQTIFYCDFFYLYFTRVLRGSGKMSLPMPV